MISLLNRLEPDRRRRYTHASRALRSSRPCARSR